MKKKTSLQIMTEKLKKKKKKRTIEIMDILKIVDEYAEVIAMLRTKVCGELCTMWPTHLETLTVKHEIKMILYVIQRHMCQL
jgi:hypothetical protein